MVIDAELERMHEMLCSLFLDEFDNRMLQMKKQLRGNAGEFCTAFPLLYSKFIRDENFGHNPNADAPTAGYGMPGNVNSTKDQPSDSNFSTSSRR